MEREVRVDPVDVAIEMLKEELPGFSHLIDPSRMSVRIRGALPIASEVSMDAMMFPIPMLPEPMSPVSRAILDVLESDETRMIRLAQERVRQTKIIKRMVAPFVGHIVTNIREFGIDALNLEPTLKAREEAVREEAHRAGHAEGKEDGIREGRKAAFREIVEAANIDWSSLLGEDY